MLPACSAHYEQLHPAPDFEVALQLDDVAERIGAVLALLYGWYDETEPLFSKAFSDRVSVPELDRLLTDGIDQLQEGLADALATATFGDGQPGRRRRLLIRLAVDFPTWHRLRREGLDDREAADLMTAAVLSA